MPHKSVAVHVRVMLYPLGHEPAAEVSTMATEADPHSSLAVSVAAAGMASHSTVASAGSVAWSKVGAVLSSMVNVAVVDAVLPQSSATVKVTVTEPVAPHPSDNPLVTSL